MWLRQGGRRDGDKEQDREDKDGGAIFVPKKGDAMGGFKQE